MTQINPTQLLDHLQQLKAQAQQGVTTQATASSVTESITAPFTKILDQVNAAQNTSTDLNVGLAQRDPSVSLAQVMVTAQKADLAFKATLYVRNKIIEAYRHVMDMPI